MKYIILKKRGIMKAIEIKDIVKINLGNLQFNVEVLSLFFTYKEIIS